MSGIVGLHWRNSRQVLAEHVSQLLDPIRYRGPDRSVIWCDNSVGLGQCMLWTTPESFIEALPSYDPKCQMAITSDARIDNREDLISILGIVDRPASQITDSRIILEAYHRWGENAPIHIQGDFAFAIWDVPNRTLFCARDSMGIKPFYYFCSQDLFCFASELSSFLCLELLSCQLNMQGIALALSDVKSLSFVIPNADRETLYRDLYSLPPAHWLKVTPENMKLGCYWRLDPTAELQMNSDQAYTEAFFDLFSNAVQCRLRSAFPLGVLLSGGVDSSSVAAVARRYLSQGESISIFSACFPDLPQQDLILADERFYVETLTGADPTYVTHWLEADGLSPIRDRDQIFNHRDTFFFAPNLYLTRNLLYKAKKKGVRTVLDGLDGDTVLSHGLPHLKQLAYQWNWIELARQVRVFHNFQSDPWHAYWSYLWRYGLRRGPIRSLFQKRSQRRPQRNKGIINPELAASLGLQEWLQIAQQKLYEDSLQVRHMHLRDVMSSLTQIGLCNIDITSALCGVEAPRSPI